MGNVKRLSSFHCKCTIGRNV